jgi:hypothetical protein
MHFAINSAIYAVRTILEMWAIPTMTNSLATAAAIEKLLNTQPPKEKTQTTKGERMPFIVVPYAMSSVTEDWTCRFDPTMPWRMTSLSSKTKKSHGKT